MATDINSLSPRGQRLSKALIEADRVAGTPGHPQAAEAEADARVLLAELQKEMVVKPTAAQKYGPEALGKSIEGAGQSLKDVPGGVQYGVREFNKGAAGVAGIKLPTPEESGHPTPTTPGGMVGSFLPGLAASLAGGEFAMAPKFMKDAIAAAPKLGPWAQSIFQGIGGAATTPPASTTGPADYAKHLTTGAAFGAAAHGAGGLMDAILSPASLAKAAPMATARVRQVLADRGIDLPFSRGTKSLFARTTGALDESSPVASTSFSAGGKAQQQVNRDALVSAGEYPNTTKTTITPEDRVRLSAMRNDQRTRIVGDETPRSTPELVGAMVKAKRDAMAQYADDGLEMPKALQNKFDATIALVKPHIVNGQAIYPEIQDFLGLRSTHRNLADTGFKSTQAGAQIGARANAQFRDALDNFGETAFTRGAELREINRQSAVGGLLDRPGAVSPHGDVNAVTFAKNANKNRQPIEGSVGEQANAWSVATGGKNSEAFGNWKEGAKTIAERFGPTSLGGGLGGMVGGLPGAAAGAAIGGLVPPALSSVFERIGTKGLFGGTGAGMGESTRALLPQMLGGMDTSWYSPPNFMKFGEKTQPLIPAPDAAPVAPPVVAPVTEAPAPEEAPPSRHATLEMQYGLPTGILDQVVKGEGSGPTAMSPKGAMGRYQILGSTARDYLGKDTPDDVVQAQLFNPDAAAVVAAQHMAALQKRLNTSDPAALLAAYNAGEGNFAKVMTGAMPLPGETQDYLKRVGLKEPSLRETLTANLDAAIPSMSLTGQ